MKKTPVYNNFSEKFLDGFRKSVPVLGRNEIKTFELIGIKEDKDNPGRLKIPMSKGVPPADRIFDAGDNTYKDIAFIESVGPNGNVVRFGQIQFKHQNGGKIVLRGGRAADQDMYDYLMMSNYRGNNPKRDKTITPVFNLIDPLAEAKRERESRKTHWLARDMAKEMTDDKVKILMASRGMAYDTDIEIMRNSLEKLADTEPEYFVDLANNPLTERRAVTQMGIDKQIIRFDMDEYKFVWVKSGDTICIIPRSTGTDYLEAFAQYTMENEKSEANYKELKRLVTGSKNTSK